MAIFTFGAAGSLFDSSRESKVQSPYLYLQSAGSTGADGSTYGAHIRWLLVGNLGDRHLPKGDAATTRVDFNRPGDFVTVFRSRYNKQFQTIVDFTVAPAVINDTQALWIYKIAATNTTLYLYFRDAARYGTVRSTVTPAAEPQRFIREYSPALLELEVKDKLFFAAEFDAGRTPTTVLRAEALSVESNVPLAPRVVSCRRTFTDQTWCTETPVATTSAPVQSRFGVAGVVPVEDCCGGPNLFANGSFEADSAAGFGFQTDYVFQGGATPGSINITGDASKVNGNWRGLPQSGSKFLAVDGATAANQAVVRIRIPVEPFTDYCVHGWLATLWTGDVSIPLELRITTPAGKQAFPLTTPAQTQVWEPFDIPWKSGDASIAELELVSLSVKSLGNDFAVDNLVFCKQKQVDCFARVCSENIRAVRFELSNGDPKSVRIETYDDYLVGAQWSPLGNNALTLDDATAFERLEPATGALASWQKFNDGALLNLANYRDRWTSPGGLREGVQRYITLSDTDPLAVASLAGDVQPDDGSIQVSMLDALRIVSSVDFHIARMFGLGTLDRAIASDTEEWIYLAIYDTDGPLDDANQARPVRHFYMGVPTKPLDQRLPPVPSLQPVEYGLTVDNGEAQPSLLTDANGYTPDGQSRWITLSIVPDDDGGPLGPFFVPPDEFCAIDNTSAVFYGIEYRRQGETAWRKPEIAHDGSYLDAGSPPAFETLPLPVNPDPGKPVLRHDEREAGIHEYAPYAGNWFSRVSAVGALVATDSTAFPRPATLLPPSNFAVQLIQPESPLMLTTQKEQDALTAMTASDKTLIRVTFDVTDAHDRNYAFADQVQFFFRSETPRNVVGGLVSVTDVPGDSRSAVLHTGSYVMNSQGTTIAPALDPTIFPNFVGGVLTCQQVSYLITAVAAPAVSSEGPVFTVEKIVKGNPSNPGGGAAFVTVEELVGPQIDSATQVMFMAVENLAAAQSWGGGPLAKTVSIGDPSWTPQAETVVHDGRTLTTSLRGIWASATVSPQPLADPGVYQIVFAAYQLPHHPQSADPDPVDWYKGVVRVPRASDPAAPKKPLDVLLVENLGDTQPLVLHAVDSAYDPNDLVATGLPVTVNYYPGYRCYLHADPPHGLDSAAILPRAGEGTRKTWLAARTADTANAIDSPVGRAAPVIAFELLDPIAPLAPVGPEFATWPDFYYKSSYTFTIDFSHQPFSVAFYRANETAILRALYKDETYDAVRQQLDLLGDDDPDRAARWRDLAGFQWINGAFSAFPSGGFAFPNPDKGGPLDGSAPGSIADAVKEAVEGAFTALTELPLIYDFIKGPQYAPSAKRQNIRDAKGVLLPPGDPEFDLAPMAKRTGAGFQIQFTDFSLEGTSGNLFFYCAREIGNRGRMGDPSPIAGPVQLINTRPPDAPAVKRMIVREANPAASVTPAVLFELNAYPDVQKVARFLIYRTTDPALALSVRTMTLVKTIDFPQPAMPLVTLADDFEDGFVPFGDPLFYRILALRKVPKASGGSDWAPSQASKALLTTMIDVVNPLPPKISIATTGTSGTPAVMAGVTLSWPTTAYNGTYYLDKMTAVGTWQTIYSLKTNNPITINLAATDLGSDVLAKENPDDGTPLFSRFRVRVENSSGLFNLADDVQLV